MNFNNIKQILNNQNNDDLLQWCNEHLRDLLQKNKIDLYSAPYTALLSDKTELFEHTWDSGHKAMLTRNFANVFDADNNCIGQYPISNFKKPLVGDTFQPIYKSGKWYALVSPGTGVQLYSLPDLKLITEVKNTWTKVIDIYCPRFAHEMYTFTLQNEEHTTCITHIDNDIENNLEWESAPFAFVQSYDPYCSGPTYIQMIDLRYVENGQVSYYENFLIESPDWLSLRQSVNLEYWSKENPMFELTNINSFHSTDGQKYGEDGWASKPEDYDTWVKEAMV